jgi:multiple sugar transport system permease protein
MKLGASLGRWLDLPVGSTKYTWRKFWKDSALAYLFLLPTILVLGTFVFYPVLYAFYLSLTSAEPASFRSGVMEFVGLANYTEIFQDPVFWKSVTNTIIYVVGTVPVQILFALLIAMGLNKGLRFRGFYRMAFFVPYVTTTVAISMVWAWIFHDQWGLLNYLLSFFGVGPQKWLLDPKWTMFTIIIMSIWKTLGYTAILFLAGLQNVDKELYNAAKVDGANSTQIFWNVTWPMLSPTTFFVTITSLIGAFKVFTEIFVLYGGRPGPTNAGITIVFYVYDKAWSDYRFGYASAASYVLFFMVMAVTLFQLWYAKKRVHYD